MTTADIADALLALFWSVLGLRAGVTIGRYLERREAQR